MNGKVSYVAKWALVLCLVVLGLSIQGMPDVRAGEDAAVTEKMGVAEFRSEEDYKAPEKPGYVFSGWYTDEACTKPLGKEVKDGEWYAKFVPKEILGLKTQVLANVLDSNPADDDYTSIRFVTTVDSLQYEEVGFEFVIGGKSLNPRSSNKVYEVLYGIGEKDGEIIEYTPQEFHSMSIYFKAWTFTNIPKSAYETEIQVKPFWVTLDGTTVYGNKETKTVQQGIDSYFSPTADTSWYDEEKTEFTLYTPQQLYGFAELAKTKDFAGKTVNLGADIALNVGDAKKWATEPAKNKWTPMCVTATAFAGTFDGQGHTISGLYTMTTQWGSGLFKVTGIGSTVKNFSIINSYFEVKMGSVEKSAVAGSIAGRGQGNFENIYSDAIVVSDSSLNGGLIGQMQHDAANEANTCTISNCQFAGEITAGGQWTGGIVGRSFNVSKTTIEHCLFTGTATSEYTYEGKVANGGAALGGIIGSCPNGSILIKDTLSIGIVNDAPNKDEAGSVIGWNNIGLKTVVDHSYASKATNEKTKGSGGSVADGTGAPITNGSYLCEVASMTGVKALQNLQLDYDTYWTVPIGKMPVLKSFYKAEDEIQADLTWYIGKESPYDIATKEQLYSFAELTKEDNFAGQTIRLDADITVNEGDAATWGETAPVYAWTPIGGNNDARGKRFVGTFDGQGNSISGLYTSGTTMIGLFAVTDTGANVKNLSLVNSYFESANSGAVNIAGIVGAAYDGNFENIYCDATIVAENGRQAGGILGYAYHNNSATRKITVSNCWFAGSVDAYGYIGGMIGYIYCSKDVTIEHSLNTGRLTGTEEPSRAGGIVGCIRWATTTGAQTFESSVLIEDCLNIGKVQGGNQYCTGSIIGQIFDANSTVTFTNVYASNESFMRGTTAYPVGANGGTQNGKVVTIAEADLTGIAAYTSAKDLDYKDYWIAILDSTPILKSFYNEEDGMGIDTSWYDETKNEFTIMTASQLYGLAGLSQMNTFENKTVYLGADIEVDGTWELPIGVAADGKRFAGTFDGCDYTISGISAKTTLSYLGLFAATEVGSTIKNLRLTDSYFEQQGEGNYFTGSIVADCRGAIENVYSDAVIKSGANQVGGIVARANGWDYKEKSRTNTTMADCWYAGTIYMINDATMAGGISGILIQGEWRLENCLFTGTINSNLTDNVAADMGGICGRVNAPSSTATSNTESVLTLESCVSAGNIVIDNRDNCVGALVGRILASVRFAENGDFIETNASHLVISNSFAGREVAGKTVGAASKASGTDAAKKTYEAEPTVAGQVVWSHNADRLMGYCKEDTTTGYAGAKLDFTSGSPAWIIRDKGVPVPATFDDLVTKTDISTLNKAIGLDVWGLSLADAVHYGKGKYVLNSSNVTNSSYDTYQRYIAKLTDELGFTIYADNMDGTGSDGVRNTIYTKADGDWVLNVLYLENIGTTNITVTTGKDTLSPNLLSENVTKEGSGNITLGMVTLTGSGSSSEYYYGNSFVFRLPNGHFIINDGGNIGDFDGLIQYLKKSAGIDETDMESKIYVDAWTVSHQHSDHFGVIRAFRTNPDIAKQVCVEAFYINEPNIRTMDYISSDDGSLTPSVEEQYRGMRMMKTSNGETTPVYNCQTGQRYYFNGIVMDVIQSQELISASAYGKRNVRGADGTDFNTSSTNLLFTTDNGKKIFIGGDSNYVNMEAMIALYGKDGNGYTTSSLLTGIDVFVAFHHGKNMSYNIKSVDNSFTNYLTKGGTDKFEIVLFPCSIIYNSPGMLGGLIQDAFPAAKAANDYLKTCTSKYYHYGEGTVEVTLGNTITSKVIGK